PSAEASRRAVSGWTTVRSPRSRSLTVRVLMPALSASSSWVIPNAARSCLSDPAKVSVTGLTVTQNGDLNGGFVSWRPAALAWMIRPDASSTNRRRRFGQGGIQVSEQESQNKRTIRRLYEDAG